MSTKLEIITITGPTASGKTNLAAWLAYTLGSEILSADSRQVYRGMDIGTGKDLSEYEINNVSVPYHLIDICNAGEKYNLFEFQHDFHQVFSKLKANGIVPILCGGTGLYIESVLKGYNLLSVPENKILRENLSGKSIDELKEVLQSYGPLHNTTDLDSVKRAIRAIEIADFTSLQSADSTEFGMLKGPIFCINIDRETRRSKITERLKSRLNEGLIQEVKNLLDSGIQAEDLIYYGLEYKYVTLHLTGQLTSAELFSQLEIAIHQFAKRQMTWFRGMEKRGFEIRYIDYAWSMENKIDYILNELKLY